ncbi:hypothetical protein BTS2_1685 [Bacillus sp. TS-2]|nr:hypothetical protein BTS2_1685 [Bacillus sp. TS-2]
MKKAGWILQVKKDEISLQEKEIFLFQQSKVVTAVGSDQNKYLLFFYKNRFLNIIPSTSAKKSTFLYEIKKRGKRVPALYPLLTKWLPAHTKIKSLPAQPFIQKIKDHYSLEEAILVISQLDCWLDASLLKQLIHDTFLQLRRGGKLQAAYRLGMLLDARSFQKDWVHSLISQPDYKNAAQVYQKPLESLYNDDPIFVEQKSYLSLPKYDSLLFKLYEEQHRTNDSILLHTILFLENPTNPKDLLQALTKHLNKMEIVMILLTIKKRIPTSSTLHSELLRYLLQLGEEKQALKLYFASQLELDFIEKEKLLAILEETDHPKYDLLLVEPDKLSNLISGSPRKFQAIVEKYLPSYLNKYSLEDIHDWLGNLSIKEPLPIKNNIAKMIEWSDNPEKQLDLGHLSYQLKLYDKAVECFSWEVELNPENKEPLSWLMKSYQHLGKKEEAKWCNKLLLEQRS